MLFSKILDNVEKRDIGLQFVQLEESPFLKTGIILPKKNSS